MATHALARRELEALLRTRKLDRTVAQPGEAGAAGATGRPPLPTGMSLLDERLGGGLPRGQVSEIVGARSSGRTTLMCTALAAAIERGELAALVDTLDMFDPESAASCGMALDRLLWLRGEAISRQGQAPAADERSAALSAVSVGRAAPVFERLLDRALKAVDLVLQAGGFDLVVLDLAEVPSEAIRRLPFTTWFRLQRAIEGSGTACLLIGPAPIARSAEGVSIQLSRGAGLPPSQPAAASAGQAAPSPDGAGLALSPDGSGAASLAGEWSSRLFLGFDIEARIVRSRAAEAGACSLRLRAHDSGCTRGTARHLAAGTALGA